MSAPEGSSANRLPVAWLIAALLLLNIAGFFRFPGRTILQSDTQIYLPILEHLWDPTALANDIVATRPHVHWTLYDELVIALRWILRIDFEWILMGLQFLFRLVAVTSIYGIARAVLGPGSSLLVAAIFSLGATVQGPAVLVIEYEPVPRGFALPFMLASCAAVAHGRYVLAAVAGTVAFAFHPPTAIVCCGLLALLLWSKREFKTSALMLISPALMFLSMAIWGTGPERHDLFVTIDPALEQLQRTRASYNWVSLWLSTWITHYRTLLLVLLWPLWRLRRALPRPLLVILFGFVIVGALAVPLSYLLLERARWIVAPQLQPGRYLLYVTLLAGLLSAIQASRAAVRKNFLEAGLLFFVAVLIPIEGNLANVMPPQTALATKRLWLAAGLAVVFSLAAWLADRKRWTPAITLVAALLPFWLIPRIGEVRNFPSLHTPELQQLVGWAKTSTPKDAMFQFAGFNTRLEPGVFRARALRAIFVDWKGGGQVNFLREFAGVWRDRWEVLQKTPPQELPLRLNVDYVVYRTGRAPREFPAVFQNKQFTVVRAASSGVTTTQD